MDDCNQVIILRHVNGLTVQIPLWTIVTIGRFVRVDKEARSDSSMDDCNTMDNLDAELSGQVQIPLWTIVTRKNYRDRP